ncbi:hypothetical protein [Thermomonospora cellulosilytica]|uniref:Uncharacterized protein n=1 Tax=Thermomonospora cellulosilytica TaxID=1411118 RepID=A0A7W3MXB7_9ACTN|nr:hypothetical protein [Thermomonospora cellulosilytica]MBA9003654.1 hypothetical protein [Thermomonospora cellulosilytica]
MSNEQQGEVLCMDRVDAHPDAHRATEPDEESVLRELYGEPGEDGVYAGEGRS